MHTKLVLCIISSAYCTYSQESVFLCKIFEYVGDVAMNDVVHDVYILASTYSRIAPW